MSILSKFRLKAFSLKKNSSYSKLFSLFNRISPFRKSHHLKLKADWLLHNCKSSQQISQVHISKHNPDPIYISISYSFRNLEFSYTKLCMYGCVWTQFHLCIYLYFICIQCILIQSWNNITCTLSDDLTFMKFSSFFSLHCHNIIVLSRISLHIHRRVFLQFHYSSI